MFDAYLLQAFFMVALCSGVPVLAGSLCSLLLAVLQTATQIQEQSISYLARLAALVLVFGFAGRWFSTELLAFFREIVGSLALLGKMP